jgi:hypothetical protein
MNLDSLEIIRLKQQGKSYRVIGLLAGVSRQRIQQILSPSQDTKNKLVRYAKGKCSKCGKYIGSSGQAHHRKYKVSDNLHDFDYLCTSCHIREHRKIYYCGICKKEAGYRRKICKECTHKLHYDILTCSVCGNEYEITKACNRHRTIRNTSGQRFCSTKCYGHWAGLNQGFGKHPENGIYYHKKP